MSKLPKISIITVVYNGSKYIEATITSVIHQNYSNFEYIIVDGHSSDETVSIINKYRSRINVFISEEDNGIYDAMNKGIDLASGEWVIFMNCGDFFYNNDVLTDIFEKPIDTDIMLIQGDSKVRSDWGEFIIKARPKNDIWKSFVHQSLFSKIEVNRKFKFNLVFKAAADFDFVYTLFHEGYSILSVDLVVSDILYVSTGFSAVNEVMSKKEVLKSINLHRGNTFSFLNHYIYHWLALIRKLISIKIRLVFPQLINYIRIIRDTKK